jgi:hypothetical protein
VSTGVDLRIDFESIHPHTTPNAPATIPAELRVTVDELVDFYSNAWHVATMVLPLAATQDPLSVPPTGSPTLELHITHEQPETNARTRTTEQLVDLSIFGRTRQNQLRDLAIRVTTPLDQAHHEINSHVKTTLKRMAAGFGYTATETAVL